VHITGVSIGSNSQSTHNTFANLAFAAGGSNITVTGNTFGSPVGNLVSPAAAGLALAGTFDRMVVQGNTFTGNDSGTITFASFTSTNSRVLDNAGYNPVGQSAISVGASPFTYTAGVVPEEIYLYGGTVSSITRGGTVVANASPARIALPPNGAVTVTYAATPVMVKDVQ